jgi:ABC-type dipeptide/oligopeptide/nickel transport system ATPase component
MKCAIFTNCGAGVAGGAASGKSTVCDMIIQQLHDQRVVLVNQVMTSRFQISFGSC